MNQPQPTQKPKSYLKWLLVILAIVILAAVGVYFFYVKGGNVGGVFSLSSPTPTKSAAVSPSSKTGSTKTATPTSSDQTATPQSSPTTSTPTPAPPAGWKYVTTSLTDQGHTEGVTGSFSVLVKENWKEAPGSTLHSVVGYGPEVITSGGALCPGNYNNVCPLRISIGSISSACPTQYQTTNAKGCFTLSFFELSESDQNIIRDSFKIIQ